MLRYNHILLIDDEGIFREGAALQLQAVDPGIKVTQARSAEDAKARLLEAKPDLIFLDLDFGSERYAGLAVLDWLKASDDYGTIPVIVMSSHRLDRGQVEERLLARHAAGYVCKSAEGGPALFRAALVTMDVGQVPIHGARPTGSGEPTVAQRLGVSGNLRPSHLRVLAWHVKGTPYKQIASKCSITEQSVREYIGEMCKFFKVKNSKALIYEIARAGVTFEEVGTG